MMIAFLSSDSIPLRELYGWLILSQKYALMTLMRDRN